MSMEKGVILIDGGYLNRILKSHFNLNNLDYYLFCENICHDLNINRLRTYYYHALPIIRKGNQEDKRKFSQMQRFLAELKRLPRFEVKLGKLQLIGGQFKQKMIDVLMSLDIVKKALGNEVKHIVLIAGDADFVPAIKSAKDNDVIIHLFYHPSSVHNQILDEVDELHIIDIDFINKCKKIQKQ